MRHLGAVILLLSILWLGHTSIVDLQPNTIPPAVLSRQTVAFATLAEGPDPNQILGAVNAARYQRGLAPLQADSELAIAAQARADDMKRRHYYDHRSPTGLYYYDLLSKNSRQPKYSCENLGMEFTRNSRKFIDSWLTSHSGHRECLLKASVSRAGYAAVVIDGGMFKGINQPSYIVVAIHASDL